MVVDIIIYLTQCRPCQRLWTSQPIFLAKHPAFSTNHLADVDKTTCKYSQKNTKT